MWVMIASPIPTNPFPCMLGLYWAVPWPDVEYAKQQAQETVLIESGAQGLRKLREAKAESVRCRHCGAAPGEQCHGPRGNLLPKSHSLRILSLAESPEDDAVATLHAPEVDVVIGLHGVEPNWNGALGVQVGSERVRIFPHEVRILSPERMRLYVLDPGDGGETYTLIPDNVAQQDMLDMVLDGDLKVLYEHALVDGCSHSEAIHVALGHDIDIPDAEFAPVGWYRPPWSALEVFCEGSEMARIEKVYGKW